MVATFGRTRNWYPALGDKFFFRRLCELGRSQRCPLRTGSVFPHLDFVRAAAACREGVPFDTKSSRYAVQEHFRWSQTLFFDVFW